MRRALIEIAVLFVAVLVALLLMATQEPGAQVLGVLLFTGLLLWPTVRRQS